MSDLRLISFFFNPHSSLLHTPCLIYPTDHRPDLVKFPGFSQEKVVSILWVVEVFTSRKLYPNVAYLPKKTVDSVTFWDPGFRGGGGISAGKANHGKTYFIFPSPDRPYHRGNSGLGRVEVGCAG